MRKMVIIVDELIRNGLYNVDSESSSFFFFFPWAASSIHISLGRQQEPVAFTPKSSGKTTPPLFPSRSAPLNSFLIPTLCFPSCRQKVGGWGFTNRKTYADG